MCCANFTCQSGYERLVHYFVLEMMKKHIVIYVKMSTHTHTHTHTQMYTKTQCTHTHTQIHPHPQMHTPTYTHTHTHTHTHMGEGTHIHINGGGTHTHIHGGGVEGGPIVFHSTLFPQFLSQKKRTLSEWTIQTWGCLWLSSKYLEARSRSVIM